jgi:hypothetical protein
LGSAPGDNVARSWRRLYVLCDGRFIEHASSEAEPPAELVFGYCRVPDCPRRRCDIEHHVLTDRDVAEFVLGSGWKHDAYHLWQQIPVGFEADAAARVDETIRSRVVPFLARQMEK